MAGDPTLFGTEAAIEASWRVVDPLLAKRDVPVLPYRPGTWGPAEADALVAGDGGWHTPVSESA
jgi:glucose-6-phosphate 1-dehydrogenase